MASDGKVTAEELASAVIIARWIADDDVVNVALTGTLDTGGTQELLVDSTVGALSVIDTIHHEVHEGEAFEASYKSPDGAEIADDGTLELLLVMGATLEAHATFIAAAVGNFELLLAEVTVGANGTALEVNNLSAVVTDPAEVRAFHTPVLPVIVRTYLDVWLPGGTGGKIKGGSTREEVEHVFAPNKLYLLRLTNRSGGAQVASLHAQWYEV